MFDQEVVGALSAKRTKQTHVLSNVTRVVLGLGGWTTSVEGGRSWRGAALAGALVSVKVAIKRV